MPPPKVVRTEPDPPPLAEALAYLASATTGIMSVIRRNNSHYIILSDTDPEFVQCENRVNLALAAAEKELKALKAQTKP